MDRSQQSVYPSGIGKFSKHPKQDVEGPEVISQLLEICLDILISATRSMENHSELSTEATRLRRATEALTLWGNRHDVIKGSLATVLSKSKRLRRTVAYSMELIVLKVIRGVLPKLPKEIQVSITSKTQHRELSSLIEQCRTIQIETEHIASENTSGFRDSSSPSDDEDGDLGAQLDDLKSYIKCLIELDSALLNPAVDMDNHEDPVRRANNYFGALIRAAGSKGMRIQHPKESVPYHQNCPFLRDGLAARILSEEELQSKVIGHLIRPDKSARETYLKHIRKDLALRTVLLILLWKGNEAMFRQFEDCFLKKPFNERDKDVSFPFDESFAVHIFGKSKGIRFFNWQFPFAAVTISEGKFRNEFQFSRVLPYLEQTQIGKGAHGKVYKVKVERGHYEFRQPRSRNKDHIWLARKDFKPEIESYEAFKAEDLVMKEFMRSSNCPSSIMTSLGSLVQTFSDSEIECPAASIFFPPAMCNLLEYITNDDNHPESHTRRLHNVQQMLSICNGLEWLSQNLIYVPDDDQYVHQTYYHCDLKPENILVCEDQIGEPGSVIFKIADFGQALGLRHMPPAQRPRRNGRDWAVPVAGRERTYLAPEVQDTNRNPEVAAKSDVWSFGCIFLLVILFNYENTASLDEFRRRREAASDPDHPGDHFFRMGGPDVRNPAVTSMIDNLIIETKERRKWEIDAGFAHESLQYLRRNILVLYNKRHAISDVSRKLHHYYNDREPLNPTEILYTNISTTPNRCITLRGGQAIFCSPNEICVFSSDPNSPVSIRPTPMGTKWPDTLRPKSNFCSDTAICAAAESKGNISTFKFTIHRMVKPTINRDPSSERKQFELGRIRARVEKIAFSPDGNFFALACMDTKDSTARVRMYAIDELERLNTERSFSDYAQSVSTEVSASTNSTLITEDADILKDSEAIFRGASYNVDLIFSRNSGILYHTLRTTKRPPQVKVTVWRTNGSRVDTCKIDDTDTSIDGLFLTTVVPFSNQIGFMCITHNRFIIKRTWHGNYFMPDTIKMRNSAQLVALMISEDDKRMVILAHSGGTLEIWGAFLDAPEVPKKLKVSDKIVFRPEVDGVSIVEDVGSMKLLMTILEERKSYKFDLEFLFTRDPDFSS